ncbi:Dihydropteroate synthase-like protein [Scheffersomyces xylosifermentans]|uniref:Dihydropteroate synthase-like protein n=1 Tax=Scheffersomyces xylosifermentans TaxID=1304137 RepID=UPI00315C84D6
MLKDKVFAKEIAATAITGKDAWNRPSPEPISISISLNTDFLQASITDNLKYSLNYAVICRNISEFMKANEHRNFKSLGSIAEAISEVVLDVKKGGGNEAQVVIKSNKSEIRAESVEYKVTRSNFNDSINPPDEVEVKGLRLLTIIGVFTFERFKRQIVDIDLNLKLQKDANVFVHEIIDDVVSYVESSNFKTVEALVMKIGQLVFQNHGEGVESVFVKVTKPNAISYTEGVGVSSIMKKESFAGVTPISQIDHNTVQTPSSKFNLPTAVEEASTSVSNEHTAYIAFGSNEGSQIDNIQKSLRLLEKYDIKVESTSSLYISKPMYYIDQADFVNGAVKVSFKDKSPHDLLQILKKIEYEHINRVKEFDNGPRSIDLDIILYDDISINDEDLIIPHKLMLERTFVMQPLCELIPPDFIHPVSAEPIHNHLKQLLLSKPNESLQESSDLWQVVPLPRLPIKENILKFDQLHNSHETMIMGILNITPDSFSDGGKNFHKSIEKTLATASQLIDQGAKILDIGGVSTRPGSKEPTEEEELNRVLPIVKAIRSSSNSQLANCLISIDTYRANVAEQCLLAGADIINDISMGLYDDKLFSVVAKYGCPYIMNHTRGTPESMSKLTKYESNTNDDIIEYMIDPIQGHQELNFTPEVNNLIRGVSRELGLQILKAFESGVRKWQVILDPGIGFAKNLPQNLYVIKHASLFKRYSLQVNSGDNLSVKHSYLSFNGLATLLGPSRKKFLGTIIDQPEPAKRVISTAASVIACIEQHTDIVRVHDVKEIKEAVLTGDAIYRNRYNSHQ